MAAPPPSHKTPLHISHQLPQFFPPHIHPENRKTSIPNDPHFSLGVKNKIKNFLQHNIYIVTYHPMTAEESKYADYADTKNVILI